MYYYTKVQGENVLYAKVQGDKVLLHPGAGGNCIFTRVAGAARSRAFWLEPEPFFSPAPALAPTPILL